MATDRNQIILQDEVRDLIRRKARRLRRAARQSSAPHVDFEAELTLRVLERLAVYDPSRGRLHAYLAVVLDRVAANLLRGLRAGKRRGRPASLHHRVPVPDGPPAPVADVIDRDRRRPQAAGSDPIHRDLCADLETWLATLPAELRDLADRLRRQRIAEIARETGRPRTSFYTALRRLRRRCEDAGLREYLQ